MTNMTSNCFYIYNVTENKGFPSSRFIFTIFIDGGKDSIVIVVNVVPVSKYLK